MRYGPSRVLAGLGLLALLSPAITCAAEKAADNSRQGMVSTPTRTSAFRTLPHAYWGAGMEGDQTYAYYYGGTWGDAPWDANTWARFESNAGKKVSVVSWGIPPPWKRSFRYFKPTFRLVRVAGDLNLVTMGNRSVPLQRIARGRYDRSLRRWARQAARWGHPFFLRLDPEMNGPWEPYAPGNNGNTAREFIRMWRHFHRIAHRNHATNITWVWCPNVDPHRNLVPFGRLYPGRAFVDWTCLDGYNHSGTETFLQLFRSSYKRLLNLAPRKPMMVGETSSVEGGDGKAAWITDALATQLPERFPRIRALIWLNWRIYQRGTWWDWPIESSASAQAAFRDAIASPYYAAGGFFGGLPRGSQIKPP